nr:unnamed protein product [Callosobruchus analis]
MDRDLDMLYNANRDRMILENRVPRRYIRDMENPLELYNGREFKKRFRFSKDVFQNVLVPLVEERGPQTNRGLPVHPVIGLLLTLRFYATGSFQVVCGDLRGFHQSTVSRVIKKITRRISSHSRHYIKFPENLAATKAKFQQIGNFPGIIGCIDCTHVVITSPGGPHAELFRNRKQSFSINVQVVGGPDQEIYDIVARYPGSYHDSNIFNRSSIKSRLERRLLPGYVLGDSGYPLLPYLLTPYHVPRTPAQIRYNEAHTKTRNTVERLFGSLKRKFPCLRRGLANEVTNKCYIIVSCATLFNISKSHNDDDDDNDDDNVEDEQEEGIDADIPPSAHQARNSTQLGQLIREQIVHRYFD